MVYLLVLPVMFLSAVVLFQMLQIGGRAFLTGGVAGLIAGEATAVGLLIADVDGSMSALLGVLAGEVVFLVVSVPVERTARAEAEERHEYEMALLREKARHYKRTPEERSRYRFPD